METLLRFANLFLKYENFAVNETTILFGSLETISEPETLLLVFNFLLPFLFGTRY